MNGQWLEPILALLGLVLITLVTRAFFMLPERDLPLPDWLPQFDAIFLRNVLIYFDNEAKAEIVRRVLGVLLPFLPSAAKPSA